MPKLKPNKLINENLLKTIKLTRNNIIGAKQLITLWFLSEYKQPKARKQSSVCMCVFLLREMRKLTLLANAVPYSLNVIGL